MKLLRYGPPGREKPGLLDASGTIRDLSGVIDDIAGDVLLPESLARLKKIDQSTLPIVPGSPRIGACVGRVGKMIGVALNYADHAAEANVPVPKEPLIFIKANTCISGPNDDIVLPKGSTQTDWEVELGVVIGTPGKNIARERALDHVAGYCVANDLSERAFQFEGVGQWTKGKSADTFGPIGPWLVTADEVADWAALEMWLDVDGRRYQKGSTRTMVFGVPFLISDLSRCMSLQAGDVILTGTPPGVGLGQKPPVYLRAGQQMRLGIAGLGEQHQRVVSSSYRSMAVPDSLLRAFDDIVGRAAVLTKAEDVVPFGFDGTAALRQRPGAVVFPRTTDAVARCVRAAGEHGTPIVTRGSGTGLSGGSVPDDN